jgi:hypothetical protein
VPQASTSSAKMKADKGGAFATKKSAPAMQASISSFFKPKASSGSAAHAPAPKKSSEAVKEAAASLGTAMEVVDDPHTSPAAAAADKNIQPKRTRDSRVEEQASDCKDKAEESDEEALGRRTRRRVRVSLKESSSEEEGEECGPANSVVVDSDGGAESAPGATQSGEPTPTRSAVKTKREALAGLPKPTMAAGSSRSKGKEVADKADEDRHDLFVKKVGLFQKNKMVSAADTGPTQSAGKKEQYGGVLQTCALQFPRNAKLTPFEDQVVEIKKKHPDKVLLIECGYKYKFLGRDAEIASKVLLMFSGFEPRLCDTLDASRPSRKLTIACSSAGAQHIPPHRPQLPCGLHSYIPTAGAHSAACRGGIQGGRCTADGNCGPQGCRRQSQQAV